MADAIRITGLKELRKELRAIDATWPKELAKVNKAIGDMVAEGTRSAFASQGGSAVLVPPTVKAMTQQAKAVVKVGGGSTVGGYVAMGNLFGSGRYKQFPRPGQYALFPTIKALRGEIEDRYLEMLSELLARAFPD